MAWHITRRKPDDYRAGVKAHLQECHRAWADLNADRTNPGVRDAFTAAVDGFANELSSGRPPKALKEVHKELIAGLEDLRAAVTTAGVDDAALGAGEAHFMTAADLLIEVKRW